MKKTMWVILLLMGYLVPTLAFGSDAGTPTEEWQANVAVTYETGDFGTNTTTNTTYIPLSIKRLFEKGDVSLTIPYIYQQSAPGVTAIAGRPFRTSPFAGGPRRTESGLGDMLLRGSYYLITEQTEPFNLTPIAQIKFPTADDDKGLGTGEFDETIGLESSKTLNEQWALYLNLYYTFIGDPPSQNFDNEFAVVLGPGYYFNKDTRLSLLYEERTALVDGRSNPRDLLLNLNYQMNSTTSASGGISIGLSNGSPDFGITAGMGVLF